MPIYTSNVKIHTNKWCYFNLFFLKHEFFYTQCLGLSPRLSRHYGVNSLYYYINCSRGAKCGFSPSLHNKTESALELFGCSNIMVLWVKSTITHLGCIWWHFSEPPGPFPLLASGLRVAPTPLLQHEWWPWMCGGTEPESLYNPRGLQQTLWEPKPSTHIYINVRAIAITLSWKFYSKRKNIKKLIGCD